MKRNIRTLFAVLLIASMLFGAGTASAQADVTLTIWTFGSFFTDFYEGIKPAYKEIAPHVDDRGGRNPWRPTL